MLRKIINKNNIIENYILPKGCKLQLVNEIRELLLKIEGDNETTRDCYLKFYIVIRDYLNFIRQNVDEETLNDIIKNMESVVNNINSKLSKCKIMIMSSSKQQIEILVLREIITDDEIIIDKIISINDNLYTDESYTANTHQEAKFINIINNYIGQKYNEVYNINSIILKFSNAVNYLRNNVMDLNNSYPVYSGVDNINMSLTDITNLMYNKVFVKLYYTDVLFNSPRLYLVFYTIKNIDRISELLKKEIDVINEEIESYKIDIRKLIIGLEKIKQFELLLNNDIKRIREISIALKQ